MQTAAQIIDALGGVTAVANGLELPLGTVSAWSTRDSIPSVYWPKLVALADNLGKDGVTYEALAQKAAARKAGAAA